MDQQPIVAPLGSPFRNQRQRQEDRVLKRQALLLAAVRMFNERGFHATSLDDVAASLGVTKPVIYHHLGNKDQVLFECVRIGLAQLLNASQAVREGGGTGLDRLGRFLRLYLLLIMDDFGRCVIRTGDEALSPESRVQFRALKREIDQTLRHMIGEAVADGSAAVPDIRIAAFTIAGAMNWTARWHAPDGQLSAGDISDRIVATLCNGLAPRP